MSAPVVEQNLRSWTGAVWIPVGSLVLTDWNCNVMKEDKLAELISDVQPEAPGKRFRFDEPLQVVPIKQKRGKYLVIGGEHRLRAMKALDQDEVPCVIRHDLANKTRKELMLWSVRRNNLRGEIDRQKYAEMEAELIDHHGMTAEAARESMLINGRLAKALRGAVSVRANEEGESDDGHKGTRRHGDDAETDGARDEVQKRRSRHELLQALKVAEEDVLLDSADTVEHGYLFFAQGSKGQTHLVVNESQRLSGLVKRAVSACKGNSAKIDDFLCAAIEKELKNWE